MLQSVGWQRVGLDLATKQRWLRCQESACSAGDLGLIPGLRRSPGGGNDNPTPVLLPGESHGQRSMVGYSPWGHKELDTTEQLTL